MGQQGRERNESVHAALLIVKMQKETPYGSKNPYGVQRIEKPNIFENGVWGVATSGLRAAAPHSAPSHGEGVWG